MGGCDEAWIERNHHTPDREFVYLSSLSATRHELANENLLADAEYVKVVRRRVEQYKGIEESSGRRFRMSMADISVCGPLIVGDNRYGMWVLGTDDAVSISQENGKMCDILALTLKRQCQTPLTCSQILSELGLDA